jgi:hypothetical protein
MTPGTTIAAGITIGLVTIARFAIALSYEIFGSKQRQGAAEIALVRDHEETARINREIGQQAEAHDNEVATAKAATYEKIPEIQVLRALEAEDRRELTKRPLSPTPPRTATHGRRVRHHGGQRSSWPLSARACKPEPDACTRRYPTQYYVRIHRCSKSRGSNLAVVGL